MNFVVVRPPEGLATVAVYKACRASASPRPIQPLLDALLQGNIRQAGGLLFNRLQMAAEGLSPWIARLSRLIAGENCLGHGMSGSGTAYFGLFRTAHRSAAGGPAVTLPRFRVCCCSANLWLMLRIGPGD